ncbi:MAG TPA: serine hydroxymethyltransferase [Candidatus Altiarchaeales archaeon]|nr:serine hydroxymethyltransferase [Candidatus Altiarchaeales archaeon]HEX54822.1 serine hydroxymethyltransferase [Candidatus Altiarchaeales archaeon]
MMEEMNYYDEVINLIERHHRWRGNCINMIASENITSIAVREAIVSDFGHRYAEGLLGGRNEDGLRIFNRFYQGTKYFDKIEGIAMKLAEELFEGEHANVVPISGVMANLAVYNALTKHNDKISGLTVQAGGHISHTRVSAVGVIGLREVPYVFDNYEMNIDVDKSKSILLREKPRIMMLGASLFLFPHPIKELREIANEIDAYIVYDGAHVAGLIAGGRFQRPFKEGADVFTSSTHKTFPGPQGGIIVCKKFLADKIDNSAFPGLTSNHHLHHVAGLAIALAEMKEFGRDYANQIVKNAKSLAQGLYELGFNVLCEHKDFTESHQIAVDVSEVGRGKEVAELCESANIIINKNLLPWDSLNDADNPSGIRIGVAEITRIGMKESEMKEIAEFMMRIIIKRENPDNVREDVIDFKKEFNEIHYCYQSRSGAYDIIRIE